MKNKSHTEFLATVYRIWMLRYVDVPENVLAALAPVNGRGTRAKRRPAAKYIPVIARVNGRAAPTALLPAGAGRYRMQFNAQLRKAANADVGDLVRVEISLDRKSRELAVPEDLRAALNRHAKARTAFETAPPGFRRQILKWMDSAKGESTRMRRIEVVIDRMVERAILNPKPRARKRN